MDAGRLFQVAWAVVPRLPAPLARGVFDLIALGAHAARIGGVKQLEANLARVVPPGTNLRRLSRAGMRSYLRYYCESFQLPGLTREQIDARVRTSGDDASVRATLAHTSVIGALGHLGNWDLAGAWAGRNLAHVTTVAEVLEPESLFLEFLEFRERLGMTIVPYRKGAGVFRQLLRHAVGPTTLMPLLADRDLSRDGVTVRLNGHEMLVAPGAAAIAAGTGKEFRGIFLRYERLRGERRRRAGSPWGVVIHFGRVIAVPDVPKDQRVGAMMQDWADQFAAFLADHPQDWHMLQKVFVSDLDADRLARRAPAPTRES